MGEQEFDYSDPFDLADWGVLEQLLIVEYHVGPIALELQQLADFVPWTVAGFEWPIFDR